MKIKKKKIKKMINETVNFRSQEYIGTETIRYYDGYIQALEFILKEGEKK